MDKFTRAMVISLVIQVAVLSALVSHLSYKLGYEQGRASIYREFAEDGTEGTQLIKEKGGYYVDSKGKPIAKVHK